MQRALSRAAARARSLALCWLRVNGVAIEVFQFANPHKSVKKKKKTQSHSRAGERERRKVDAPKWRGIRYTPLSMQIVRGAAESAAQKGQSRVEPARVREEWKSSGSLRRSQWRARLTNDASQRESLCAKLHGAICIAIASHAAIGHSRLCVCVCASMYCRSRFRFRVLYAVFLVECASSSAR